MVGHTHISTITFQSKASSPHFLKLLILWLVGGSVRKQQSLHSGTISGEHLHLVSKKSNCKTKIIGREQMREAGEYES